MEHPIGVIDSFALLGSIAAGFVILRRWRCGLSSDVKVLFAVIVCFVLFRNLSNVLEWFEVTARLSQGRPREQ